MSRPIIPMAPEEFPRKLVHLVVDLPPRPKGFEVVHWCDSPPAGLPEKLILDEDALPVRFPGRATYLFQAEWALSPMHNWISAYSIASNRARSHWFLWSRTLNDHVIPWRWESQLIAYAPRVTHDRHVAAVWLVAEWFRIEAEVFDSVRPSWLNEFAELSLDEVGAILRYVWPEKG